MTRQGRPSRVEASQIYQHLSSPLIHKYKLFGFEKKAVVSYTVNYLRYNYKKTKETVKAERGKRL